MKNISIFVYAIFGLFSICNAHFTYYNECYNTQTGGLIQTLFQNKYCLSMILLCNDQPELVYTIYTIPKVVKKISLSELKPNYQLTTRPRRDIFDREKTLTSLCSENSHSYIIIVKNIEDLLIYMFSEIVTAFWSPQSLFLIYFIQENCDNSMKVVFENLWRIYKTPQVIITGCDCNYILFYNPFFGNDTNRGVILNNTYEEVISDPNLIVNHMSDFNKYPVKSVIFESLYLVPHKDGFKGIDHNLLNLMAKRLNFTPVILFPFDNNQYGFKAPNGSFTGALKRLLDGDADCIAVHYFIKDYLTTDIEFGASSLTDKLCIILRKADRIPDWQLLYFCLDKFTWIFIVMIYFVMAFSWIFIQKLMMLFRNETELHPFIFMDTFRLMITSSIYRLPTTTPERILLAFCLVAFVTLVGAFQGSLIEVFATPMFYKDLNTLEELSRSDTQIKSQYIFFIDDVFSDKTLPVIAKLKSMISYYNDTVSITQRIATDKTIATLIRKSEVEIDNSTIGYYDEDGYNLIHMVKECARTYSLAYLFPVNSPYAPKFSMLIIRIAEAGLFDKWYDEMVFNSSSAASKYEVYSLSDAITVFSVEDMQIAFLQVSIGLLIAFLVFLIEVCTGHGTEPLLENVYTDHHTYYYLYL